MTNDSNIIRLDQTLRTRDGGRSRTIERISARRHNARVIAGQATGDDDRASPSREALSGDVSQRLEREALLTVITAWAGFDSARLIDDVMSGDTTPHTNQVLNRFQARAAAAVIGDKDVFSLLAALLFMPPAPPQAGGAERPIDQDSLAIVSSRWPTAIFWAVILNKLDVRAIVDHPDLPGEERARMLNLAASAAHLSDYIGAQVWSFYDDAARDVPP